MKKLLFLLAFVASVLISFSQDVKIPAGSKLAMYVEYGGKGIKLGVLAFTDPFYRKYQPIENKELNVGLSKAIQSTGRISKEDISSASSSSYDAYKELLSKYSSKGLLDQNIFFYTSSGVGVASNVQELCDAVYQKTNHKVYVVGETEEAKYTIAGTIPYEKIDYALVLDQGGSNTKGGYVIRDGKSLTGIPTNFDLGSVRISDMIITNYMKSQPDDPNEYRREFINGMNLCFDSLKTVIKRTFSNIDGAESRSELYLSGGAAFVITTLMYPEASLKEQMVSIDLNKLKGFLTGLQERDFYNSLKSKTFAEEDLNKNYQKSLKIYNHLQLLAATKLLVTYVNALGGDEKSIYFNRYGLHSMPSMLMGRVLRGDIPRW
jgi:hypothetical protein